MLFSPYPHMSQFGWLFPKKTKKYDKLNLNRKNIWSLLFLCSAQLYVNISICLLLACEIYTFNVLGIYNHQLVFFFEQYSFSFSHVNFSIYYPRAERNIILFYRKTNCSFIFHLTAFIKLASFNFPKPKVPFLLFIVFSFLCVLKLSKHKM